LSAEKTQAITGVFGVGEVGTVTNNVSPTLTGNSIQCYVGDIVFNKIFGITGVAGVGDVGSILPGKSAVLSGVTASRFTGTPGANSSAAITGNAARGNVGNVGYAYWTLINNTEDPNWTPIISI
jgi:hypothetical protein